MEMNQANRTADFGRLFPTLAARTWPAQRSLSREPADRARSGLGNEACIGIGRRLQTLLRAFEQRRERHRIQRVLARFDDRLLRDIGLSRADLGLELESPFLGLGEPLARERNAGRGAPGGQSRVGLWHL
jgi:uncharacterized protein YjiS (DUF1127 family)